MFQLLPGFSVLTVTFAAWLISSTANYARAWQAVEIEAAIGAREIYVGESVDYAVEIRNAENPTPPDLSDFKQRFDIAVLGDESRNQSSVTIINGRISQTETLSHVYRYRLTPKATGKVTVPAAKLMIDGQEVKSRQFDLQVIEPELQDHVVASISVDAERVYPSQPFKVTLTIWVRPLPDDSQTDPLRPLRRSPPQIQINWLEPMAGVETDEQQAWLQPLLAQNGVGFRLNEVSASSGSFFDGPRAAIFDLAAGRENRDGLDGESVRYYKYQLSRTFIGKRSGLVTFGPALVKGTFVSGLRGNDYQAKNLVVATAPVNVEVREVPQPRPANFCGGIGRYQWSIQASPTKLRTGDPLTLTLEVTREQDSGSLELISAPDLSANSQLINDFELIDTNPTGRADGSVKRFTYALRPKRAGVSLPALTIASFDPYREQFSDVSLPGVTLEVSDAVTLSGADLVGALSTGTTTEIKARSEGIFQNITEPALARDQSVPWLRWWQAAGTVWLIAAVLATIIHVQRRQSSDPVWLRKQQASKLAFRRLQQARQQMQQGDRREAVRLLRASIFGLVADTQNRVVEGLTTADVTAVLASTPLDYDARQRISRILETIDAAEFGGGQSADLETLMQETADWITRQGPKLQRA